MAVEVERKFVLPEQPPWLREHPSTAISQGYLVVGETVEVRLRDAGGKRLLTVKRGHGEVREEVEIPLDYAQFEALWPLTEPLRVEKRRHLVPLDDDLTAEVDVFEGRREGLVLAEIEFPSEDESKRFRPPPWLGREVTGDDRYANQTLAQSAPPQA